jgi:hypothetical protein
VGESTGDENAKLYTRGVKEGYNSELLDASALLDILDVFGEDGLRSYLAGVLEGEEQAVEVEEDFLDEGEEGGD